MNLLNQLWKGAYDLFADGGFSIAGAMAFSMVLAIFPFFIFVGALAGYLGGPELAAVATAQIFQLLPKEVAQYLVPQIESVLGQARYGLLTAGGITTLFFASSGIESLRWALNTSYEDEDLRSVFWLRAQSFGMVILSALVVLFVAYVVVFAPLVASYFGIGLGKVLPQLLQSEWLRWLIAVAITTLLLYAFHAWLPAVRRKFSDVWPGIALTILLWTVSTYGFSYYLGYAQYGAIYAGLSQIVVALMFFYIVSAIMIFGAEFNHARLEDQARLNEISSGEPQNVA